MKIKTLTRSAASHQAPGSNVSRQPRNLDPALHPFERAREYTRALNAVKLERMFAAPFLAQLGRGHVDGVYTMANDPTSLEHFASGSADGVVKVWDLTSREEVYAVKAHENLIKSMCWTRDRKLLSCGTDRTVKLFDPYQTPSQSAPTATYQGASAFTSLSHHRHEPVFAAAWSSHISLYDLSRPSSTASQSFPYWPTSVDTINAISFNQVEPSLLAITATDRRTVFRDLRTDQSLPGATLTLPCNAISWNPQEAFNFALASEDHNIYIFDMRHMSHARNILKDHVAAVTDVAFDPTGQRLVSASYDRTVRLWSHAAGHSQDVYHTKRMQRVFAATFTPDGRYVLSGSSDGNVRLWRAQASSRAGVKSFKQRQALEYADALKERYRHMPEIRRIARHRHVPKAVKKAGEIKREELGALKRREENRRKHKDKQDGGKEKRRPEREKMVLAERA